LLVDCFAGPGKFDDNEAGSPLIMCRMAEKYAKGHCVCVFVNKERSHHEALKETLDEFVRKKIAFPIHGDSQALLREVQQLARKFTLFVYLDPFGLKGCELEALEKLLETGHKNSTEIVVNLSMPTLHRFACRHAVAKGREDSPQVKRLHNILDQVLGGDYWKKYMFDDKLSSEEREWKVMGEYRSKLKNLLQYVGSCPVREKEGARIKYFITICSRHPDAIVLMNEFMCAAYNKYMHAVALRDAPLLAAMAPDWKVNRQKAKTSLKNAIIATIKSHPKKTRLQLWEHLIQDHFMLYLQSEYRALVKEMVDSGDLESPTPRPGKRLNDNCILNLAKKQA